MIEMFPFPVKTRHRIQYVEKVCCSELITCGKTDGHEVDKSLKSKLVGSCWSTLMSRGLLGSSIARDSGAHAEARPATRATIL